MGNFATDFEIVRISNDVAAGQGTTDCAIVDMEGYDEVTFICQLGTVTNDAIVTLQVGQYSSSTSGSMVVSEATTGAITSDGTTIALSNKCLVITVTKPSYRYLEAQVVKADENVEIDSVIAILSKGRERPSTNGSTVYTELVFASPAAA
jgi:hypothetical protein